MSMYVHKTLMCVVTDENYTKYGISSLEDPDLYRIIDMPEDLDLLTHTVTFGDPTWNEEDKTVCMYPVVALITDEYKQHLIQQYHDACFDDLVENGFESAWKTFVYRSNGVTYRFPIDIGLILNTCRIDRTVFHPCHLPVLVCDNDDPNVVLGKDIIFYSRQGNKAQRIYECYTAHLLEVGTLAYNKYRHVKEMPYESIVANIKKQNAETGIIPDNMEDEVVLTSNKDTFTRQMRKK